MANRDSATGAGAESRQQPQTFWPAVRSCAEAAMPDFLLRQRWYPAKDAGRPAVAALEFFPFPGDGGNAAIEIWHVTPPRGAPLVMFVPLAVTASAAADPAQTIATMHVNGATGTHIVEAFSNERFVRDWLEFQFSGQSSNGLQAGLRIPAGEIDWKHLPVRRSSAEQSNTSLRIGDAAILKVIRKVEAGAHPELEIGRFLADAGFAATPALLGWAELMAQQGGSYALTLLQRFVPNEGDGWSWTLDQLTRGVIEARAGSLDRLARWIERLATRTAEMHRAFAADSADPAFRPEPVARADLHRWQGAAAKMAARAFDGLQNDPHALQSGQQLLRAREQVGRRLNDITQVRSGFVKTRHHGDFHLGQVLVAGDDAVILDFEGEPLRPLEERRAKHCVLRDVAGIVRSFSYAAEAVLRALPEDVPDTERNAFRAQLEGWRADVSRRFRATYFAAAQGLKSIPRESSEAARLLNFFLLEKALYEVAYELANRPDWVEIPVQGVLSLLRDASEPTARRRHAMPFGAEICDGGVRFRLWAPSHGRVAVELDGRAEPIVMQPLDGGWHELITAEAGAGSKYRFVLPDGSRVPDPASRFQPEDVHGLSEVIDPCAYGSNDAEWSGRPWEEAVIYELHVGAFTPQGTFAAAAEKLDHLRSLGVTAIELMPLNDFPGHRNWGYDGVLPYAPDSSYGRPDDLKRLIDRAHAKGIMVLLDVVYNHFGPEGAYGRAIAPEMFTSAHKNPWGDAFDLEGESSACVREFFIQNALYWIEEFHVDGLRIDAAHTIIDNSAKHLLEELAERVRGAARGRHVHLVLENEENDAWRLVRDASGAPRWYTAQWNDDVHHVLHVAATGEDSGYYADYCGDTLKLARALAEGFAFQGEMMPFRGRERGERSRGLPPSAFVAFIQNHDQIGNRAFGDRLTAIARPEAVRAVAAAYLLLPQIPMLFMGEEWGASQPFPFFCDFGPKLAGAVRKGRRAEFARFPEFQDPATRKRIPDPVAEQTFASAKLRWDEIGREPHAAWLDWYRRIIAMRHREIVPLIPQIRRGGTFDIIAAGAVSIRWTCADCALVLEANLSEHGVRFPRMAPQRVLWREGDVRDSGEFGPFSVRWSLCAPR